MSPKHSRVSRYRTLSIALSVVVLIPCLFFLVSVPSHAFSLFNQTSHLFNPLSYLSTHKPTNPTTAMGDNPFGSCPQNRPLNTSKRTEFGRTGCTVYGHPSAGGILIKEADIVDMRFLHLDRFAAAPRSTDPVDEDNFCKRMRMLGATWWADEQEWIDVQLGLQGRTEVQERRLVFGWPTGGDGVWVLRYESERALPRDFGRISLSVDMDERCRVMREYGARFYDDPRRVEELNCWL